MFISEPISKDNDMSETWPSISIVVPTEGRVELTKEMLRSLVDARAQYPGQIEIIIVDSSVLTMVQEIEATSLSIGAKFFRGPHSVRKKRNIGANESNGQIVQFIDSDCSAESDLFIQHATIYRSFPQTAGVCGLTKFAGRKSIHWRIIELTNLIHSFRFAEEYDRVQWCTTSNLSLRSDYFKKMGGFEEDFPFRLGGDDLDLTYRITQDGGVIRTNPKAIVYHSTKIWSNPIAVLKRAFRWGRMSYYIYHKHKSLQFFDLPKPVLLFAFLFFLVVVKLNSSNSIELFTFWGVSFTTFVVAKSMFLRSEPLRWRRILLPIAWLYELAYEIGMLLEFTKHGDFQIFYRRLLFSLYQLNGEWRGQVRLHWVLVLSFLFGWFVSSF